MPSLIIDVRPGETPALADGDATVAVVELLHKSGQLARLRVTAPRAVRIEKQERADNRVPSMASFTQPR